MSSEASAAKRGRPPKRQGLNDAFAKRLNAASDNNPNVPPMYHGRYPYVVDEMRKRGLSTTTETIRRWYHGEAIPSKEKMPALAQLLGVDEAWLSVGAGDEKPSRRSVAKRADNPLTTILATLITNDGGTIAWPADDDRQAVEGAVDIYAMIKGVKYAFRVAAGTTEDSTTSFALSSTSDKAVTLGIVQDGFCFKVFDLTEFIDQAEPAETGGLKLAVDSAALGEHEITTFSKRP